MYRRRRETKRNVDFKDLADGMNSAAIMDTIARRPLSYRQRRQSMRRAENAEYISAMGRADKHK